jgi:hypothetical protein
MNDHAGLQQQVEFLEVQLQDSKQRELNLQRMYNSLLQTLDEDTLATSPQTKALEDLRQTLADAEKEHAATLTRLNTQLQSYAKQLRTLKEQLQDSEYKQRTQKLGFEESLMELRKTALTAQTEKHQVELKLRQQRYGEEDSREQLSKSQQLRLDYANKEAERLKEECEREVQGVRQQTETALSELRSMYDKEKECLELQLRRLQQAHAKLKLEHQEVTEKLQETTADYVRETGRLQAAQQETEVKARRLEEELSRAAQRGTERKGSRTPLDKTRRLGEVTSSGPDEVKRLRCQLTSCRSDIASLENNDRKLKDSLQRSQDEVERLQRAMRSKGSEEQDKRLNTSKQQEHLLYEKDSEISSLKRQIGDLKGVMNLSSAQRPPAYSPKGQHSRSKSFQRGGELSPMFTLGSPPDLSEELGDSDLDFGSLEEIQGTDSMTTYKVVLDYSDSKHYPGTQQSTLLQEATLKELQLKLREQSMTIKELLLERDRAKLDSEKLLIQLKHFKLEWAVEAERYAEKEMELKTQLRQVVGAMLLPGAKGVRKGRCLSQQCSPR